MKLYKTTVVIWSESPTDSLELMDLAYEATSGGCFCETQQCEEVTDPKLFPATEFFDPTDEDEDEDDVVATEDTTTPGPTETDHAEVLFTPREWSRPPSYVCCKQVVSDNGIPLEVRFRSGGIEITDYHLTSIHKVTYPQLIFLPRNITVTLKVAPLRFFWDSPAKKEIWVEERSTYPVDRRARNFLGVQEETKFLFPPKCESKNRQSLQLFVPRFVRFTVKDSTAVELWMKNEGFMEDATVAERLTGDTP